ncbi:tetratricopeptide repeat protein [Breoghania sp.]|uniref:tetratricopeptide repeat protein n=1 Tax=Breoghania sp. TaxID=2065378 RepID=UPI002AA8BC6D|nr:tetratricopeptide repeat protein [Breoghania sp.]
MNRHALKSNMLALVAFGWLSLFLPAFPVLADEVEGSVVKVEDSFKVHIRLPEGKAAQAGDEVKILADIPGIGPVAIATPWRVESFADGTAIAAPEGKPSGTPQVGYIARIETSAVATPATSMEPEQPPVRPDDTLMADVPVPQEAEAFFQKGMELFNSKAPADIASGVTHLRRAATMRHPGAMSELGAAFTFGRGIAQDPVMGREWLGLAAKLANAKAMVRLGLMSMTGTEMPVDEKLASDWIHKSAAYGSAHGMLLLAFIYEDGMAGVPADLKEAVSWLEEAAKSGNVLAMYYLGDIYLDGEDGIIPKDIAKAEDYWTRAARAGHAGAMKALARFYRGKDAASSQRWAQTARTTPAMPEWMEDPQCLGEWECYKRQDRSSALPGDRKTDRSLTDEKPPAPTGVSTTIHPCDRLAANSNDPDRPDPNLVVDFSDIDAPRAIRACEEAVRGWPDTGRFYTQLATAYYKAGRYSDAFQTAMKGSRLGSSQSSAIIGLMYKNGNGARKDPHEALNWFEKAAHAGNMTAMHFAATMHLKAEGVPYNPVAAAEWYKGAADLGSAEAMAHLGVLYDNRQGVPYDPDEAAASLLTGLTLGSDYASQILIGNFGQLSPHTRVAVQGILRRDGLYHGALDGKFGPQTLRALVAKRQR